MGDREVEEDNFTLLRVENDTGTKMYVVQVIAKKEDYIYSKRLAWVNAETWTIPQMEFYDRKGRLLKIMKSDWVQIDGIWNPAKMVVDNQLTGHRTQIENSKVKYNQGLKREPVYRAVFAERRAISGHVYEQASLPCTCLGYNAAKCAASSPGAEKKGEWLVSIVITC